MTTLVKQNLDGVSPGAYTTTTAGTGDTPGTTTLQGSGQSVVATGLRPPRLKLVQTLGTGCAVTKAFASQSYLSVFAYLQLDGAVPGTSGPVLRVANGGSRALDLTVTSSGKFKLYNAANSAVASGETSPGFVSDWAGKELRLELQLWHNRVFIEIYEGDADSVDDGGPLWSFDSGTLATNTFGSAFDRVQLGNPQTSFKAQDLSVDSLQVNTVATTGPLSGTDPSVSVLEQQAVLVTLTGTPGMGGTLTYAFNEEDTTGHVVKISDTQYVLIKDPVDFVSARVDVHESPSGRTDRSGAGADPLNP